MTLKIGFVGKNGCGKSTMIRNMLGIEPPIGPTIGMDYMRQHGVAYLDFSGDEVFHFMFASRVYECDWVVLCFDVSDASSMMWISEWKKTRPELAARMFVLGLKPDLSACATPIQNELRFTPFVDVPQLKRTILEQTQPCPHAGDRYMRLEDSQAKESTVCDCCVLL